MRLFKGLGSTRFYFLKHRRIVYMGKGYWVARLWYKVWRNNFFGEKWLGKSGMISYVNRRLI